MIKANELRIGNWVSKQGEDYQCDAATILMLERNESEIDSISITEEWLLRFGFEKKMLYRHVVNWDNGKVEHIQNGDFELNKWIQNDDGRYHDVYFSYDSVTKKLNCYSSDGCEETTVFADIKYIHQLQNLYIAITEKEI